jgi:hypothetical protein
MNRPTVQSAYGAAAVVAAVTTIIRTVTGMAATVIGMAEMAGMVTTAAVTGQVAADMVEVEAARVDMAISLQNKACFPGPDRVFADAR